MVMSRSIIFVIEAGGHFLEGFFSKSLSPESASSIGAAS